MFLRHSHNALVTLVSIVIVLDLTTCVVLQYNNNCIYNNRE